MSPRVGATLRFPVVPQDSPSTPSLELVTSFGALRRTVLTERHLDESPAVLLLRELDADRAPAPAELAVAPEADPFVQKVR